MRWVTKDPDWFRRAAFGAEDLDPILDTTPTDSVKLWDDVVAIVISLSVLMLFAWLLTVLLPMPGGK